MLEGVEFETYRHPTQKSCRRLNTECQYNPNTTLVRTAPAFATVGLKSLWRGLSARVGWAGGLVVLGMGV